MIKVAGQALAAVTTAGVGAYLGGAEGTVSGAAIASVVTTVGDAFYQRSLERTRDKIRSSVRPRRAGTADVAVASGSDAATAMAPSAPAPPPTGVPRATRGSVPPPDERPTETLPAPGLDSTRAFGGDGRTQALGADGRTQAFGGDGRTQALGADGRTQAFGADGRTQALGADGRTQAFGGDVDTAVAPTALTGTPETPEVEQRRPPWKRYAVLVATTLLVFLIAMVAITGIERVKGSPIGNGGGSGTSIGSVFGAPAPAPGAGSAPAGRQRTPTTTSAPATSTSGNKAPGERGGSSGSDDRDAPTSSSRSDSGDRGSNGGGGLLPGGLLSGN